MTNVITRERNTALVLLAFAIASGVLAYDVEQFLTQDDEAALPRTLPMALAWAGGMIGCLMLIAPHKEQRSLSLLMILRGEWPRLLCLAVLMVGYGVALRTIGFFVATSSFLILGYLLLGERRLWVLLFASLPIALAFALLLSSVFQLAIHSPILTRFGIMA